MGLSFKNFATMLVMALAAVVQAAAQDYTAADCVTEQPAGELKTYGRSGEMITAWLGGTQPGEQTGMSMKVVFAPDGNTIWFYNLLASSQDCRSWVKGEIEGEKIIVKPGQVMSFMDYGSYYQAPLLTALKENPEAEENSFKRYVSCDDDIIFTYVDGVISLTPGSVIGLKRYSTDPVVIELGMNGGWLGYADIDSRYTPFDESPVVCPVDESKMASWSVMYHQQVDGPETGHLVKVAIDGDDIYVKGLFKNTMPDATIKGEIKGDKAVFAAAQYMGQMSSWGTEYLVFAFGADTRNVDGEDVMMLLPGDMVFDYDPQACSLSYPDIIVLNGGTESIFYCDLLMNPKMAKYEERAVRPLPPVMGEGFIEYVDRYEPGYITIYEPCTDVDGNFINPENLALQFFIDGEQVEFSPADYFFLTEPMSEIPYGFSDDYFIDSKSAGFWWMAFFNPSPATLGARSVYHVNGETLLSDMTIYDVADGKVTGIDKTELPDNEGVSEYYDIQGRRVTEGSCGFLIERTVNHDGSVTSKKIIRR